MFRPDEITAKSEAVNQSSKSAENVSPKRRRKFSQVELLSDNLLVPSEQTDDIFFTQWEKAHTHYGELNREKIDLLADQKISNPLFVPKKLELIPSPTKSEGEPEEMPKLGKHMRSDSTILREFVMDPQDHKSQEYKEHWIREGQESYLHWDSFMSDASPLSRSSSFMSSRSMSVMSETDALYESSNLNAYLDAEDPRSLAARKKKSKSMKARLKQMK